MALTRDFRETVQADAKRDPAFRRGLLSDALESLLAGEVALGKELLRDYINATVGFPTLAEQTKLHVKTRAEGVRFEVRSTRAAMRSKQKPSARPMRRTTSAGFRR
jgi:hypothetical protein